MSKYNLHIDLFNRTYSKIHILISYWIEPRLFTIVGKLYMTVLSTFQFNAYTFRGVLAKLRETLINRSAPRILNK